jgi:peptidyl-prolyl cis-trans isomerase SurA
MFHICPAALARLAALVLALGGVAQGQDVLNGIAAVVNDEVVTFSQVRELVGAKEQAARQQFKGEQLVEKIKEIRLQAINDLIDRQLILQEFKKQKFQIPDYFINDRVNTVVREEFGGDRQAFLRTIEAQGYTVDRFKETQRDTIIVQEMTRSAVKQNVIIPEAKIMDYYKEHLDEFSTNEEVKLRMISIKKGDSSAAKRRLIEEIRAKIIDGAEFGDMAHMYSDHNTQEQFGDWGWINRKTLNEELTKAVFALKAGEVSRVLDISDSYYLLWAEAKKAGVQQPFKAVRDDIEKRLIQQERQKLRQDWLEKLRKKAFIKMY